MINISKRPVFCLLMLLCRQVAYTDANDSLLNVLNKTNNPVEKASILNELATKCRYSDTEASFNYSKKALEYARAGEAEVEMAKACNRIGTCFRKTQNPDSAIHYFTLALSIYEKIDDKGNIGNTFNNMGNAYADKEMLSTAKKYLHKAVQFQKEAKAYDGVANSLSNLGSVYLAEDNYDSALVFYKNTLRYDSILADTININMAITLNDIGGVYFYKGDYARAVSYYLDALHVFEEFSYDVGCSRMLNNIGNIYFEQKNYDKALEYYQNSAGIKRKLDDKAGLANTFCSMGIIHFEKNNESEAYRLFQLSKEYFKELGDNRGLSKNYRYTGKIEFNKGNLAKSKSLFNKALELSMGLDEKSGVAECYAYLGKISMKKGEHNKSLNLLKKALTISTDIGNIELQGGIHKDLADNFLMTNNYKQAVPHLKHYIALIDSIFKIENRRIFFDLQARYETEKKLQEIAFLNKDNELKNTEIKKQRLWLLSSIMFVILLGLISFSVILMYRNKKKTNSMLNRQNLEISRQKDEIQLQKEQLEKQANMLASLDELKSKFFANISHELRTPLTLIISPLSDFVTSAKTIKNKEVFQMILRNARRLQSMIDELLQLARMEKGAVDFKTEWVDINRSAKMITSSFHDIARDNGVSFCQDFSEKNHLTPIDQNGMEKVFSNLISNAIKFTPKGKKVSVKTYFDSSFFHFIVSDQGMGIDKNEQEKIFERFYRGSNATNSLGTGIGLSLVRDMVTLHQGTVTVSSTPSGGAEFHVQIPLNTLIHDNDNAPEKDYTFTKLTNKEATAEDHYKLLVVEDYKELRTYLTTTLSDNYKVLQATNGLEGLRILENTPVDIIVSDVMMPGMDGYTFAREIRENRETCHIPIILLTAKASEISLIKGLEAEADAYITKPFSMGHLRATLVNQLKIRNRLRDKFNTSVEVNPSEITTTSMDEKFIQKAIKTIKENIEDPDFSVDLFCNKLAMGRTSVHRKLTALTGLSTSEFIMSIRLKRAAQLLRGKTAQVSEIAYTVGFKDVSYFTKCFKKKFKITPSEFVTNS